MSGIAAHIGQFVERRLVEDLQRQLARSKNEYLALIGHELRTPLTVDQRVHRDPPRARPADLAADGPGPARGGRPQHRPAAAHHRRAAGTVRAGHRPRRRASMAPVDLAGLVRESVERTRAAIDGAPLALRGRAAGRAGRCRATTGGCGRSSTTCSATRSSTARTAAGSRSPCGRPAGRRAGRLGHRHRRHAGGAGEAVHPDVPQQPGARPGDPGHRAGPGAEPGGGAAPPRHASSWSTTRVPARRCWSGCRWTPVDGRVPPRDLGLVVGNESRIRPTTPTTTPRSAERGRLAGVDHGGGAAASAGRLGGGDQAAVRPNSIAVAAPSSGDVRRRSV